MDTVWRFAVPVLVAAATVCAQPTVAAESGASGSEAGRASRRAPGAYLSDYDVDAATTAGYRFVDHDGSKGKYREDYDLRPGGRLFNLSMDGDSDTPDATAVDRFHLELDTPGNEPVSHFRLTAKDRERFDFRANFTRSRYKYAVPQLYEAAVPGDDQIADLHDFDIVRTNGAVDLTVRPKHLPPLHLGYRLYNRDGGKGSTSTVRIPGGDTFVVRAPFDTATNVGLLGTNFRAFDTDVFFEQEFRHVERDMTLRDPLDPDGLDPTDSSILDAYQSDEDDRIDIPATTVRLRRTVGDSLDLTAAYFFSHAHLSFDRDQLRDGTSNVPGLDDTATASGEGHANLTTHIADLETTFHVSERVRLYGTYRYNDRSQDGSFDEVSNAGFLAADTEDDVRLHRFTGEVELQPRESLLLRGGMRFSHRDADLSPARQSTTTDTYGAVGSLTYRPRPFLDLFAKYENVQIDDPYRVPGSEISTPPLPDRETALTFVNRGSAGLGLKPRDWVEIRYRLTADSLENDTYDGRAWALGNTVSLVLSPVAGLTATTSYTWRERDRHADILVAPLYEPTRSLEKGTENILVSVLRYDFRLLGQRWSGGWTMSFFDSDSTLRPRLESGGGEKTAFDLDRIDGGAFLTLLHRWLEPTVEFRMIDYHQDPLDDDDYRATIAVLKVTRRFSF